MRGNKSKSAEIPAPEVGRGTCFGTTGSKDGKNRERLEIHAGICGTVGGHMAGETEDMGFG